MRILPILLFFTLLPAAIAAPVIIGNPNVPALDRHCH